MNTINIEAGDMGLVIAFVLLVGGIIKNFTPIKNELIPLITWLLGGLLYQWLSNGWSDPRQWMMALISVAGATGLHSATRSTVDAVKPPPAALPLLVIGALLAFGFTGCGSTGEKPTPQAVAYFTLADTKAVVSHAEQVYGDLVVAKKVKPAKERDIDAKIVEFHNAYLLAVKAARFNYSLKTPEDVQALAENLITIINLLAKE